MTNAEEMLKEHVTLDIECMERIYLNGYIPSLQVPGQLVTFMQHRGAGYQYRLSIWQVEFSRTQVFDDPARGRQWFEVIICDNLDVGRPHRFYMHTQRIFCLNTGSGY